MNNNKKDRSQLFVKIMAGILAGMFVLVSVGTLIRYLFV